MPTRTLRNNRYSRTFLNTPVRADRAPGPASTSSFSSASSSSSSAFTVARFTPPLSRATCKNKTNPHCCEIKSSTYPLRPTSRTGGLTVMSRHVSGIFSNKRQGRLEELRNTSQRVHALRAQAENFVSKKKKNRGVSNMLQSKGSLEPVLTWPNTDAT